MIIKKLNYLIKKHIFIESNYLIIFKNGKCPFRQNC